MKILITTGLYPPEIGGPATYTALLEKELPAYGHKVNVLPFSKCRHLPKVFRHVYFLILTLKQAVSSNVIFAQDVLSVGLPSLCAAKLLRKKFFVRVPGDYAWEQSVQRYGVKDSIDVFQNKKYSYKAEFLRKLQKIVVTNATHVITPSEYFRTLVMGWGVSSNKITTIYNGVKLNTKPASVKKPATLTLVSAGRLVSWKGFSTLIDMMSELSPWHLVILGEGPQRADLEKLIKDRRLEERVHLLGSVDRSEVLGWCKVADAFILNTHFESFSFQIVEAMSMAVPVITTTTGSLPELIENGKEGVLVNPDSRTQMLVAIKSVLTDKVLWQQRTDAAVKKAQMFSVEETTKRLSALLSSYET